ncbi:mechanosensitive ion channel domain-containing protein [Aquibaculum arenosum]|uniref:Mechanosensitive ion channel n=1 Tax=Aquibaculum arenosum TaxID=3032591 RepID=A0ABT5YJ55_9PROT|nr:mechanosensitive ion channel domain-containing protein [Fodinicurvata sp. CAU 1616]MDF2094970.1 mechanosensitive ion channel [Fodinicurvata sp. CAU 1616]
MIMSKAVRGVHPLLLALPLILLGIIAAPLAAQEAQTNPDSLPATSELDNLLQTLEDEGERQRFIDNLRTLVEAERAQASEESDGLGTRVMGQVSDAVGDLSDELTDAAVELSELPLALWRGIESLQSPATRASAMEVAGKVILVLLGGFIAEFLLKRLLARPRRSVSDRHGDTKVLRLAYLLLRTLLDTLPIVAFALVAFSLLPLVEPKPVTRLVALALINANLLSRIIGVIGGMLLVPGHPGLRFLPMSDETASYFQVWLRRFTLVGVYGYFLLDAALLLGLAYSAYAVLLAILGLVLTAMLVVLVLQQRQAVAKFLRGSKSGGSTLVNLRLRLAEIWHVLAIAYILGCYVVWVLNVQGGFEFLLRATVLSLVVLIAWRLLAHLLGQMVERLFRLNNELRMRYPLLEVRANRYLPAFHRILNIALGIFATLALLEVWGLRPIEWLAGPEGRALLSTLFLIGFVLLGALIFWEVFSAYVESTIQRRAADGVGSQRIRTLLPLAQNALRILLVVLVGLIVLSEIGVNIAPLLAGAGVVGLAIGFGAQTLVKDIITGVFILIEDSLSVGDVVLIAGHSGTVERLTIRSIFLRDLEGNVHTLPFSVVDTIQNYSKEYSYSLIEMQVALREDVDQVIAVMREVADELIADEVYGPNITGEFEILGLDRFEEYSVVVRVRFKTVPLMQWAVRREYNRRIKMAFDKYGIEIPYPHRTLYFGEDREGEAPPLRLARAQLRPRKAAPPPPEHPTVEGPQEIPSEVPDAPEPEEPAGRPA